MFNRTRVLLSLSALMVTSVVRADPPAMVKQATDPVSVKADAVIDKALDYFKKNQKPDFSWQSPGDPPAVTALVLKAFMSDGKFDADDTFLENGFNALLKYQKPDGGIYDDAQGNYNTAIAVSALAASKETEYKAPIAKAVAYLKKLQWNDSIDGDIKDRGTVKPDDPRYGGWGYGGPHDARRPDGSNMQVALDALHDADLKTDDPAYKAAIAFASRLQNRSESNDQKWAGNDGGFVYTDVEDNGQSAAGVEMINGQRVVRSYGSMTYAGLKSMIYAGLPKDDPRVKAAWAWIGKNYTWDENPGMRQGPKNPTIQLSLAGLYYYYHTAGRALHAYGEPIITDAQGVQHDWRKDLVDKIATLQKPDGSFVGEAKWMEQNPMIATAFAVLALEEAKADLRDHPPK